ncbi:MAG: hypothetical protein HC910_02570 [Spirulinaceae cyanobacterium SM2_1_0]|nr:hypothetical protein [Spirulinaceae cyanobacterium SM2_1_0]
MKRFRATVIVLATLVPAIAGCDLINSLNPFGGGAEEVPVIDPNAPVAVDPNAAPADPNAAPVDPNAAPQAAPQAAPPVTSQTPFRDGVNAATSAAEAVQTAQSPEQWQAVVQQWQQAIALMQAVPAEDPNYTVAQQKVAEYQGYLQYAQQNAGG